jgi:hypothetical protein
MQPIQVQLRKRSCGVSVNRIIRSAIPLNHRDTMRRCEVDHDPLTHAFSVSIRKEGHVVESNNYRWVLGGIVAVVAYPYCAVKLLKFSACLGPLP